MEEYCLPIKYNSLTEIVCEPAARDILLPWPLRSAASGWILRRAHCRPPCRHGRALQLRRRAHDHRERLVAQERYGSGARPREHQLHLGGRTAGNIHCS